MAETREVVIGEERYRRNQRGEVVRWNSSFNEWANVSDWLDSSVRRVAELEDALREAGKCIRAIRFTDSADVVEMGVRRALTALGEQ